MKVFDHPDFRNLSHGYMVSNTNIDTLVPNAIEIGENFVSATGSWILAHDSSLVPTKGKIVVKKTVIGDNVFLGLNAVVMPGVTVGDNVIIGTGSIVTKDIPSNSVAVGSPAKVISSIEDYTSDVLENHIALDVVEEFTMTAFSEFREKWETEYNSRNKVT